jgi:hypothetical protein
MKSKVRIRDSALNAKEKVLTQKVPEHKQRFEN